MRQIRRLSAKIKIYNLRIYVGYAKPNEENNRILNYSLRIIADAFLSVYLIPI